VKLARGIQHLVALAEECDRLSTAAEAIWAIRVTKLWAFGKVLAAPPELDWVSVALCVDQPPEAIPWLDLPVGAEHWSNATRMAKNPIVGLWRSDRAPVWNHAIVRPVLLWDIQDGLREEAVAALRAGRAEQVREPAVTPDQLRARLIDELAISLSNLRNQSAEYEENRWGRGNLAKIADPLARAASGYLELRDALDGLASVAEA